MPHNDYCMGLILTNKHKQMDTTEIIKNALDWTDKRLELTDQKLTEEQRNYINFALRHNLVNILPIQNVSVSSLYEDLMSNQRELINSPLRANVVSVEAIKKVFERIGFIEEPKF